MTSDSAIEQLRVASARFLDDFVVRLEGEGLLPVSRRSYPSPRMAKDYWGVAGEKVADDAFQDAIERVSPDWFGDDVPMERRRFASTYTHSFGELCVAYASRRGQPPGSSAPSFNEVFKLLISELKYPVSETMACRLVWNVQVNEPLEVDGVSITPVKDSRDALRTVCASLPRAESIGSRHNLPFAYKTHGSLFAATAMGRERLGESHESEREASRQIDRLLLSLRLRWGATAFEPFEIRGPLHQIGGYEPEYHEVSAGSHVRRAVAISSNDVPSLHAISKALDHTRNAEPADAIDPLIVATNKFTMSHLAKNWWEHIVDLMTGLEATLSGESTDAVQLRIASRGAVLLATDSDPAELIFEDLKRLYLLRSKLVHGSRVSIKSLGKHVRAIEPSAGSPVSAIDIDRVVDRLRDLLRRSILARVALSHEPEALWKSNDDSAVDRALVSDTEHRAWRLYWHDWWASQGADGAWERPSQAESFYG